MPRAPKHTHLVNGQVVGFSVNKYAHIKTYLFSFNITKGRRLQRDTNQSRLPQAMEVARAMIEQEYAPTVEAGVTWEEAERRLTTRLGTSGNRSSTLGYYLKILRAVKGQTTGPGEITPKVAAAWRDRVMSTPTRRKKLPSAHSMKSMLVGLSSLWQKWFVDELKIVSSNPWESVKPPKADKLPVKYATDEQIENLYTWIAERYGDWPFPKLFLSTKSYTGCRLMDLCGLRSEQLRSGRLVFPADTAKGREERQVPLPEDLHAALDAFKGETYLWENYLPGLKAAIEAKGWPSHQLMDEFSPQRLYFWVETLFADYRKAFPSRPVLTTHMFRKRAFTMAWEKGIDMRHASIAYGCNVDTLMKHYVLLDKQQVTDDVFARMHSSNSQANGSPAVPKQGQS